MDDKIIYNFDEVASRSASDSHKWNAYGADILPMWLSDMDFRVAEPILDALKKRVNHGIFGYPLQPPKELVDLTIKYMSAYNDWRIEASDLLLLSSTHDSFKLVFRIIGNNGDAVLMNTPLYPPLLHAPATVGKKLITNELLRDSSGKHYIDFERLEASITRRTKIFLLCNPHNPTGRVFSKPELEKLAEISLRHNLIICSDDVHFGLVYPGSKYTPIASISNEIANRTITLISPSKTFNTPGFKFSIAVARNKDIWKTLRDQLDNYPADVLGIVAATAALKDCQNWKEQMLAYLQENRDYLYNYLEANIPQIRMTPIEGTYLAWLDVSQCNLPKTPFEFFLEKGKIALGDGTHFGEGGKHFVRFNFACPRKILDDGLNRMATALRMD